jgi:hypothetical protein
MAKIAGHKLPRAKSGRIALPLSTRPTISIAPFKSGRGFSAKVIWPSGEAENVGYFRHRDEAVLWIVNDSDAWVRSHRADGARAVCAKNPVDAPRAGQLECALNSGMIAYETLPPGDAPLHRGFPVPSVERLDFDRRKVDIVQAPHIDVDLIRV